MSINGIETVDLQNDVESAGIVKINNSLEAINDHNHAGDAGNPINTAAISIDANLAMNGFSLNDLGELVLNAVDLPSTNNLGLYTKTISDVREIFYQDSAGQEVQLSNNGGVNFAGSGSLSGVTGSAGITYNTGNKRWTLTDEDGAGASVQLGNELRLENNSFVSTISSAATQASTLTLPNATGTLTTLADVTTAIGTQTSPTINTPTITSATINTSTIDAPTFSGTASGTISSAELSDCPVVTTGTEPSSTLVTTDLHTFDGETDDTASWGVHNSGTISYNTTNPITGTGDYIISVSGTKIGFNNAVISPAFTIPSAQTGKRLSFSLNARATSTTGTLAFAIGTSPTYAFIGSISGPTQSVTTTTSILTSGIIIPESSTDIDYYIYFGSDFLGTFDGEIDDINISVENHQIDFNKPINNVTSNQLEVNLEAINKGSGKTTNVYFENTSGETNSFNIGFGDTDKNRDVDNFVTAGNTLEFSVFFDGTNNWFNGPQTIEDIDKITNTTVISGGTSFQELDTRLGSNFYVEYVSTDADILFRLNDLKPSVLPINILFQNSNSEDEDMTLAIQGIFVIDNQSGVLPDTRINNSDDPLTVEAGALYLLQFFAFLDTPGNFNTRSYCIATRVE